MTLRLILTLYLDVTPEIGLSRARARGQLDRIEQESLAFFHRAHQRYRELAALDPTIVTIDATQSQSQVREAVQCRLRDWLKEQQ